MLCKNWLVGLLVGGSWKNSTNLKTTKLIMDSEPLDFIKKIWTKGLRMTGSWLVTTIGWHYSSRGSQRKKPSFATIASIFGGFFSESSTQIFFLNADTRSGWPLQITFVGFFTPVKLIYFQPFEPRNKKPYYFPWNTGWLVRIFIMVYYNPYILG